MHLATLTCNRDIRQTILQAESIQKFVSPCTHWVIVNQYKITKSNKQRWQEYLQPYYTNHKLELVFPDDLNFYKLPYAKSRNGTTYFNGWKYQFTIANVIQDDYMCLTPKNLFIKSVELEKYRKIIGNATAVDNIGRTAYGQKEISDFLQQEIPQFVFISNPPFVINYQRLKDRLLDMKAFDKFWDDICVKIYNNEVKGILDWHFYSFIMHDKFHWKMTEDLFHYWLSTPQITDYGKDPEGYLKKIDLHNKMVVLTIHRNFIKNCSSTQLKIINNWLRNKGLFTRLKKLKWNDVSFQ